MFLSNIIAFDFVDRFAAYAKVFIRQLLDGYGEKLRRDIGYLGGCCCQSLDKFFLLFGGQRSALN